MSRFGTTMNRFDNASRKLRSRFKTSAAVDQRVAFLGREALAQVTRFIRPIRAEGTYTKAGSRFRLTHGSQDVGIFEEVFTLGFYDMPEQVRACLPQSNPKVVDLGGNIGMFGLWVLQNFPDAEVVIFEPDARSYNKYADLAKANRQSWTAINACATSSDGEVWFEAGKEASSAISEDEMGIRVPAVDVFPYLMTADLIKMDVEGGEWEILLDSRFLDVAASVIVVEYHPHLCPDPDPRSLATKALESAGYKITDIFHDPALKVGMVWGHKRTSIE